MRAAALLLLAGCPATDTIPSMCTSDSDCGGEVCARTEECLPASDVRMVKVTWTIDGMAADPTTCSASPSFYIQFDGSDVTDTFGYEPVPCVQGQFSVDKLPTRYVQVDLGIDTGYRESQLIDPSTGIAAFDLIP